MRKTAIGLVVTVIAAGIVLSACASSSKTSSAGVATSGASPKVSTVPPACTGNSVVTVAPAAASNPKAPAVATFLTRRYRAVNEKDSETYWKMYTPRYGAKFNRAQVAAGYRSTEICDIRLTQLSPNADGRLAAKVTFTSTQDAADGPNGQTCTRWTVGFFLQNVRGGYLIDTPPPSYHAVYLAC